MVLNHEPQERPQREEEVGLVRDISSCNCSVPMTAGTASEDTLSH